jgi:hypothetical protein
VFVALAGCSSSAGSSVSTTPSAVSIAQRIGCTKVQHEPRPELYVYDDVSCMLNGRKMTVVTFRTDQLRDNWVKIASQFDGIEQTGHLYAVADGTA